MPILDDIPIAVQTTYADLVEKAWTGNFDRLLSGTPGSPYRRTVGGGTYWYWRTTTGPDGVRPPPLYLGKDSPEIRSRIRSMQGSRGPSMAERRDLVRILRTARLPAPDRLTGEILAAFAEAGAFRLRAVVVGSIAFQSYPGLLGVRLPAPLLRTADLDLAQFHSIAVAVEDAIEGDLLSLLRRVDSDFHAVPDLSDSRRTQRYVLRRDDEVIYAVDVLCPLRGPNRERLTWLRALRSNAQLLRFLDFLLYREVNAVALHGPGIPINVPAPERYALHKLLVSQMRIATATSQAKSRKDLMQAEALIDVLRVMRPHDLADVWAELLDRGPSWRRKAGRSLNLLAAPTRDWMLACTPSRHADDLMAASAIGGR